MQVIFMQETVKLFQPMLTQEDEHFWIMQTTKLLQYNKHSNVHNTLSLYD